MHIAKVRKQQNTASGEFLPRVLLHNDWVFSPWVLNVTPQSFSLTLSLLVWIFTPELVPRSIWVIAFLFWLDLVFVYHINAFLFLKKKKKDRRYLKWPRRSFVLAVAWGTDKKHQIVLWCTRDLLLEKSLVGREAHQLVQQTFAKNWEKLVERSQSLVIVRCTAWVSSCRPPPVLHMLCDLGQVT